MRIVSCVPSLTEWIAFLSPESLVGRTRYCIHPSSLNKVPVIGGTKKIVHQRVRNLKPDLIVAIEEENVKEQIEILRDEFEVMVFKIQDLFSAFDALSQIGKRVNPLKSNRELSLIRSHFQTTMPAGPKVLYLIWKGPWMGVGSQTFIHSMLEWAGFSNVLSQIPRYPILEGNWLALLEPEIVFLPDEPYRFQEKEKAEILSLFPKAKIILVDGSMFSWYSQRMALFPDYIGKIKKDMIAK